jgi:PBS lyase HEAT-like repeat
MTLELQKMRNFLTTLFVLQFLFIPCVSMAQDLEYRPGGKDYAAIWDSFYNGDHEPELDDPLIEAGEEMTLVICEAIKNRDMRQRRYAIGALGYIGDKRAIPTLEKILKSKDEIYYFRGDALITIYQIDKSLGKKHANEYASDHEYLKNLQDHIQKESNWLTEPTEH